METPDQRPPRQGEWIHLRARDASAPPGRIRVYFSSQDEVNRAFAPLHDQVTAVGADKIAITVHNDDKSQLKS